MPNWSKIEQKVKDLLEVLHEELDWFKGDEEALRNTPTRITNFYKEWYEMAKYNKWTAFELDEPLILPINNGEQVNKAYISSNSAIVSNIEQKLLQRIVAIKNIEFASLCSHHMLPYFGYADIYYIPKKKVLGASKLPRAVKSIAAKPSIQEGITKEIAEFLFDKVDPYFIYVRLRNVVHTCMTIRGVKTHNSHMDTAYYKYSPEIEPYIGSILQTIQNL